MQLIHCLLVALLSVTNLSVQGLSIQSPDHRSQVQVIQAYLEDVQPQVTSSSEYSKDQRVSTLPCRIVPPRVLLGPMLALPP